MIPRIKALKPQKGFMLEVHFDDGKKVLYDVMDDINTIESFAELKDGLLFWQVKLDESRTCVYWTDMIDLASDTIYEYGSEVK